MDAHAQFESLKDLLIAFGIGGSVDFALRPLRVPSLVGLLVAGAVVRPGEAKRGTAHEPR